MPDGSTLSTRPFTPETLAERWEVSARLVRGMCASGELKAFKVGKRDYRITRAAVAAYEGVDECALDDAKTGGGTPSLKVVGKPAVSEPETKTPPSAPLPTESEPPRVILWPQ